MANTITNYYTFVANTPARASEVNNNFLNHRGDLVPINDDSVSASDNTHVLGSSEHRWASTWSTLYNMGRVAAAMSIEEDSSLAVSATAMLIKMNGKTMKRIGNGTPVGYTITSSFSVSILNSGSFTDVAGSTLQVSYVHNGPYMIGLIAASGTSVSYVGISDNDAGPRSGELAFKRGTVTQLNDMNFQGYAEAARIFAVPASSFRDFVLLDSATTTTTFVLQAKCGLGDSIDIQNCRMFVYPI